MPAWRLNYLFLLMLLMIYLPSLVWAEPQTPAPLEDKTALVQFVQAVDAATKNLASLEKELAEERQRLKEESNQHQIYRTQINSLGNFLLVPDISISIVEKGVEEVELSISTIKAKIQRVVEKEVKTRQTISVLKDKIVLIDQRIEEFNSYKDKTVIREPGIEEFKSYRAILEKQKGIILGILDLLSADIKTSKDLLQSFEDIQMTLKKEIKDKKGTLLFQRNEIEFKAFLSKDLLVEMTRSIGIVRHLFTREWVMLKWSSLKEHFNLSGGMAIFGFVLFSLFLLKGLFLLKKKDTYKRIISKRTGYPLIVLEDCLYLIFWILLATTLSKTQAYLVFPDFIKFMKTFLTVILMTKIASYSIRLIVTEKGPLLFNALYGWRNAFVWGIRLYAFVYLLIYRFFSLEPIFLSSIRIFSEAVLVTGIFLFWRAYEKKDSQNRGIGVKLLSGWSKAVVGLGLFADISGYGHFASWWYLSWGISIVIICICLLLVYSMKDIDRKFKEKFEPESRSSYGVSYPFYWILSNGLYFFIVALALAGLAVSWSTSDAFFVWLWTVFHKKYAIGKIELSMVGFTFSFVVIFSTYFFIRLWEKIMTDHVLKDSGLSTGARESVITISKYAIWAIGILISLSVFGLNTTSLAVVFGAMSIGLGFGLQNIFNNFISGLILLFERPIQVGDVVEVGGIWGEVKKINVRSTLVQTYTNSSLIIPNSEFISALVTNWSHKDPYVRRDLMVGVAYGSDTQLVRKLLLEAGNSVAGVRQYPQIPRVQFINFGDSSLDFRLRFWSVIDDFVEAESQLRFEIDRLFRVHHVVIPFPQRDVHLPGRQPDSDKDGLDAAPNNE
ncbi:mechanosensitive ion channel domain-containing protein [Desulfobacula sp.]|uniref:mechanosensitive ion channel domain-containing protein n=1 Tax=Desulfobacula sp. TaxID=2593537 RepID=UPI0026088826|nr:mechanosensitive ion channel domain-containing protein [Desulfobacula sp.]